MWRHENERDERRSEKENPLKKRWIIPSFLWRDMAYFDTLCPATLFFRYCCSTYWSYCPCNYREATLIIPPKKNFKNKIIILWDCHIFTGLIVKFGFWLLAFVYLFIYTDDYLLSTISVLAFPQTNRFLK